MKNLIIIFAVIFIVGCQKTAEVKVPEVDPAQTPTIEKQISVDPVKIEVPKLANQSIAQIDKILGAPAQTNNVENGGVYRLYKTSEHQKGLAIRFYNGKAKSFNLILDKPFADSKSAIRENLGVDVGNAAPVKDKIEPLTESFQGTFGGVKFTKVAARREANGRGFVFVLAETAP